MKEGLTFDDVCLVPQFNNIPSRLDPDLSTWACDGLKMKIPIFAANMDTVIGHDLADALHSRGSYSIFHRFTEWEQQVAWAKQYTNNTFMSIGIDGYDNAVELLNLGVCGICIDIAHGHDLRMLKLLNQLSIYIENNFRGGVIPKLIAGNVCTAMGYIDLVNAGANAVKVGVGSGAACTTRITTGAGTPQFTAIQDCAEMSKKYSVPIIADGGIKGSAEIVKALAAGACSVMCGKLFSSCIESAAPKGERKEDGTYTELSNAQALLGYGMGKEIYYRYRGQASEDFQKDFKGGLKKGTVAEGIHFWAPASGVLSEMLEKLLGGLRSGMTYGGARNITELQRKAEFMKVHPASYGLESNPRRG